MKYSDEQIETALNKTIENMLLEEGFADALKRVLGKTANTARNAKVAVSNKAREVVDKTGEALQTDAHLIKNGVLLVKDGKYFVVPGIKAGSKQEQDVLKSLQNTGVTQVEDQAEREKVLKQGRVERLIDFPGNLKQTSEQALTQIDTVVNQFKSDLDKAEVFTASDLVDYVGRINDLLKEALKPLRG